MTNTDNPIKNQLKLRLSAGEVSLVMRIKMSRTVEIVGIAEAAGYHGIYLYMQHNTMSLDTESQIFSPPCLPESRHWYGCLKSPQR